MTAGNVQILDSSGQPMQHKPSRFAALGGDVGGAGFRESVPYDAASNWSQRMGAWQPFLWSPDAEVNIFRDRIVSRVRDLVRNDGWASGAVTRTLDNTVGATFRPVSKPDYRALQQYTGLKTFDSVWADEYGRALEANWRTWANDINRYCDAARKLTVSQMFHLAFRHKLIDGDALALVLWLPERLGRGKARYCTTIQMIDPDRLSNPMQMYDTLYTRGGVQIDHLGSPVGYHIRRAHVGDWFNAGDAMVWDYVERESEYGRALVIHDYDADRANQHRGGVGVLTPVLERMKMLAQYDGAELDAAIINAIFGAYIKSPFDPEMVKDALGGTGDLSAYQQERVSFHKDRNIALGGARVPHLFPGEDIVAIKSERASAAFSEFQGAMLRNVASAIGCSYEQLSQDWSKTNYSSARAAILEAWKTLNRRRANFAVGFAQPVFSAYAEESHEVDGLPVPAGAPDFIECRTAYSACRWIGPSRGWVDPVKERQGAMLGIEAGFSTLEAEAAENGMDWEEVIEQRKIEIQRFKDANLPLPSWGHESDETIQTEKIG